MKKSLIKLLGIGLLSSVFFLSSCGVNMKNMKREEPVLYTVDGVEPRWPPPKYQGIPLEESRAKSQKLLNLIKQDLINRELAWSREETGEISVYGDCPYVKTKGFAISVFYSPSKFMGIEGWLLNPFPLKGEHSSYNPYSFPMIDILDNNCDGIIDPKLGDVFKNSLETQGSKRYKILLKVDRSTPWYEQESLSLIQDEYRSILEQIAKARGLINTN